MDDDCKWSFATRAIHEGYDPATHQGALVPPLYLTSTFCFETVGEGARRFSGESPGYVYGRLGNPSTALLERRLASLEGGDAAVAFGSGMGAIASALWTLLKPGDVVVTDLTLYGCTFALFSHGLARFGIDVVHVDMADPDAVRNAIGPRTRIVYFETPANPNMRLVDIEAVSEQARRAGAITVVDNTYATPVLQRPLEMGADLVVQSATKYLGGHGDLVAGAVIGNGDLVEEIRKVGLKDLTGAVLSPFDAMLVMRGLKTLELRVRQHSSAALEIARRLEGHPAVASVLYPGLPSFPQHQLALRQMRGGFGGVIAFEPAGDPCSASRFMDGLRLARRAVSLGDAETLVQHPASMTHSTYTPDERRRHGISERLVRISVGLEALEDIWGDLDSALSSAASQILAA